MGNRKPFSISSGATAAGSYSSGLPGRVRNLDLYRKVPKDLTEATVVGGSVSIVFLLLFGLLVTFQLRDVFRTTNVTVIEIDQTRTDNLRINLNLTLFDLDCDFVELDLENVIGKRREDIGDKTVHKYALDGSFQGYADDPKVDLEHLYQGTEKDTYGFKRNAIELSAANFSRTLDRFEVVLVDFHAPWCKYCQQLAPEYEKAAEIVHRQASVEFDGHRKHSVALASFDCVVPENRQLCVENNVLGYPSIMIFRQSQRRYSSDFFGNRHYELYRGERKAEKIAAFALSVLEQVQQGDVAAMPLRGDGHDVDKDGVLESRVSKKGCRIDGYINVQPVPGRLIIQPKAAGVNFDPDLFNADHFFAHLSFGDNKDNLTILSNEMENTKLRDPHRDALRNGGDGVTFQSQELKVTYSHYVKVVSTLYEPLSGDLVHQYDYNINSNSYSASEHHPHVVINYDISPLRVVVRETSKPWIQAFTGMAAIVGGVYTCSVLFESALSLFIHSMTKKVD